MNPGRAALLIALVVPPVGALLAAQPDPAPVRQQRIGGWLVEALAEADGGRLVRLTRRTEGARLQFQAAFWHGNDGRIQAVLVERSDCTDGEEIGRHVVLAANALRVLLSTALAHCAVPPRRIDRALGGLERAYALAAAWADEAEAATAAEERAIADYGQAPQ